MSYDLVALKLDLDRLLIGAHHSIPSQHVATLLSGNLNASQRDQCLSIMARSCDCAARWDTEYDIVEFSKKNRIR